MSKILEIIINPNPILRKKSQDVNLDNILEPKFQEFLLDMEETMLKEDGVGLAAPQIGKNIRVISIKAEGKKFFIINPTITKVSWKKVWDEEGCLSVPDIFGKVERHKKINLVYYNEKGKKQKLSTSGFLARVIQHEIDHLDGILFIDKAKNLKKLNY